MNEDGWHEKCFYRVSIKAVIRNAEGKILLVKEKNNPSWNLPGGGMDYEENEEQALARGLLEEVGYEGSFTYRALGIWPHFLGGDKQAWQMWVVYDISPEHYEFSVGEHSNEIAFHDPEDFKDDPRPIYKFSTL